MRPTRRRGFSASCSRHPRAAKAVLGSARRDSRGTIPRAQNLTGVFISHNMQHVFQSCDRVVAMARGEIVFDSPIHETSIEQVHEFL